MNFDNATIEMTKKGNLRIDGKKYVAVTSDGSCSGCVLRGAGAHTCAEVSCVPLTRSPSWEPSGHVIFFRKKKSEAV